MDRSGVTGPFMLRPHPEPLPRPGRPDPPRLRSAWSLAQNPYILAGLVCYAVSLVVWILALSRVEVSLAYPMLSLGYIVTAIGAWMFFSERLSLLQWLGIVVIIVGVALLARGST